MSTPDQHLRHWRSSATLLLLLLTLGRICKSVLIETAASTATTLRAVILRGGRERDIQRDRRERAVPPQRAIWRRVNLHINDKFRWDLVNKRTPSCWMVGVTTRSYFETKVNGHPLFHHLYLTAWRSYTCPTGRSDMGCKNCTILATILNGIHNMTKTWRKTRLLWKSSQ